MDGNGENLVDFGGTTAEGATDDNDGVVVDFSNVADQAGFAAMPRGIYNVTVDDCTYGLSQASGNPMWTFKFEVEDGEFAKRKLFFHAVFAASSMPRTKKTISIVAPELLASPFNPKAVAESGVLLGRRLRCRVDIRKYQGEDRNNVRDLLPAVDGGAAGGEPSFM